MLKKAINQIAVSGTFLGIWLLRFDKRAAFLRYVLACLAVRNVFISMVLLYLNNLAQRSVAVKSLLGILACLSVLVVGCGENAKRSVGPSAVAAKVATDDSSTPATTPPSTSAVTPDSVWASLKAQSKYTSAGSSLAAFIMAAAAGDLAAVTSFVQAGVDKEGQALVTVAGIGRVRTALHLVEKRGMDVDAANVSGQTVLYYAGQGGSLETVKFLVGQGANVNATDKYGDTVLHEAARYGPLEVVKYLVGQGASVTATSNNGGTPRYWAVLFGRTAVANYLKSVGG